MIEVYEAYSPLDHLGRCGRATACLGPETLPPEGERRGEISHILPSGWHLTCYAQNIVPGESLFNRTHLIARCLCENGDVPQNLITGTQHLNQSTMQPLENRVVDYIRHTENHVLYQVTPFFEGDELVARGLRMEARSIEDNGSGLSLNMFCRNVQPGVAIDYATGESHRDTASTKSILSMRGYLLGEYPALSSADASPSASADAAAASEEAPWFEGGAPYVLNFVTQRFHLINCKFVKDIAARNEGLCHLDRNMLMALDYAPCGHCNP